MGSVVTKPGAGGRRTTGTERIKRVLEILAGGESLGFNDIASRAGFAPSTTHKILREMVLCDLASYAAERRLYAGGPALWRLANLVRRHSPLETFARPVLRRLAGQTGETASLNALAADRGRFTVLAVEQADGPLQYLVETGGAHALHAEAGGLAILAFLDPAAAERHLRGARAAGAGGHAALQRRLLKAKRDGYALSQGDPLAGAAAIAAPVFDLAAAVIGSLQLTIPLHRFAKARVAALARDVVDHARRLDGHLTHAA